LKARTGELTPPGKKVLDLSKRAAEATRLIGSFLFISFIFVSQNYEQSSYV